MLQHFLLIFSVIFSQLPNSLKYAARHPQKTVQTIHPITTPQKRARDICIQYQELRKQKIFKQNKDTLRYALKHFKHIKGFPQALNNIIATKNSAYVDGHLYEIEAAVALHKYNYAILSFNQLKQSPYYDKRCEIDIEASNGDQLYWIECKNSALRNTSNLRTQLKRQQCIMADWQNYHETPIAHMLCSKNPIPHALKQWLKEKNIEAYDQIDT